MFLNGSMGHSLSYLRPGWFLGPQQTQCRFTCTLCDNTYQSHKDFIRTRVYQTSRRKCEIAGLCLFVFFFPFFLFPSLLAAALLMSCVIPFRLPFLIAHKTVEHLIHLHWNMNVVIVMNMLPPRYFENNGLLSPRDKFLMEECKW